MTTTDTRTDADSTTAADDMTAVEPEPAGADDAIDTTAPASPEGDSGADVHQDDEPDEDQDDAGDGPGREAAKYRRRLREAENERDQLAGRVEALQRAEVDRLAKADGMRPAALWASGTELAGLLDDDGTVDAAKVTAAIEGAREQLGIPKPPVGPRVPREGRSLGRPPKPSGKEAMVATVMGRDALDG